jgi:hypothetical protein
MRIFLYLIAAAVLAGCATPAERAVQMQRQVDEMVVVYGPACEKLGYKWNSDQWRDCILRLDARDVYQRGYPLTTTCIEQPGFMQCSNF